MGPEQAATVVQVAVQQVKPYAGFANQATLPLDQAGHAQAQVALGREFAGGAGVQRRCIQGQAVGAGDQACLAVVDGFGGQLQRLLAADHTALVIEVRGAGFERALADDGAGLAVVHNAAVQQQLAATGEQALA
ncbi:hypothetical protein D9M68_784400 [compost metagenome]